MSLYYKLFDAYRKVYCSKLSKQKVQSDVNDLWKALKADKNAFPGNVEKKVTELLQLKTKNDAALYVKFFTTKQASESSCISCDSLKPDNLPQSSSENSGIDNSSVVKVSNLAKVSNKRGQEESNSDNSDADATLIKFKTANNRQYDTPAQNSLQAKISFSEKKLIAAIEGRDSGLASPLIQKEINTLRKEIETAKKMLKMKKNKAKRQKKYRDNRQNELKLLKTEYPDLVKSLRIREVSGRPQLEFDQPEILKAICDIAMFGGATDDRRRSEMIRSCKTLDDLHSELKALNFSISRSATYLRLLPRDSRTVEGKKHVNSVPVKLCRAQTDARKEHRDGKFCTASIRSLEQLISTLGSQQVAVISQDDKSRVPIGITAANKQAPLLMHLEYRVLLPDHDWVIASQHKLIPSVYAGVKIEDGKIGDVKTVTYSGPTHIAIRSAKHCSSTASSHAFDFKNLLELESFREIFYNKQGEVKPIVAIMSDGGPDENPRYIKVIQYAIEHFKAYNLDAIFVITNAPGRSVYNRVERRMAPLSRELTGLILPYDHFGTHLDNSRKTIDKDLEKKNFEFAGQTLAEVWNGMVIDGQPVTAEYVGPECIAKETSKMPFEWYNSHVHESQYFLQIIKCDDMNCCGEWRSGLRDILPMSNGFIPPPFPVRRKSDGTLIIPVPEDTNEKDSFLDLFLRQAIGLKPVTKTGSPVPYDFYCPSVHDQIEERTCNLCGTYFATKKTKSLHAMAMHGRASSQKQRIKNVLLKRNTEILCEIDSIEPIVEWVEETDVEIESNIFAESAKDEDIFPIINDLHEWLILPFMISYELNEK